MGIFADTHPLFDALCAAEDDMTDEVHDVFCDAVACADRLVDREDDAAEWEDIIRQHMEDHEVDPDAIKAADPDA